MKFVFKSKNVNILDLLRKAGYSYRGVVEGDMSFIKRAGRDEYPHYHIYVKIEGENIVVNMHFDQKKPSYHGVSAHSADYDGELVEKEIERIKEIIKPISN
jgi:hypothetical protein